MSERELGTYQMLWDCPACETPKLLGLTHRHCPNCGAAQDPKRRYFPNDADKVAVTDHRFTGADKLCPSCEAPAAAIAHNCASCGSALDEAKGVAQRTDQVAGLTGFTQDSAKAARDEHRASKTLAASKPVEKVRSSSKVAKIIGAVLVSVVAFVAVFFLWKKTVELEVSRHEWKRTIAIEEYRRVQETAWRDAVPIGASDMRCSREQRSTKEVADGQTCSTRRKDMGNGTFREVEECRTKYRSEPVYDQRCTFSVEKWVVDRHAERHGSAIDPKPQWPEVELERKGQCLGCEREGARDEHYEVVFMVRPANEEKRCSFSEQQWVSYQIASKWKAKSRVIGGGLDCDTLIAN